MRKQMMLTLVLMIGIAGFASAQTKADKSSQRTKVVKEALKNDSKSSEKGLQPADARLNQRKIYHFSNGQRSTPTGKEATSVNGGYAALKNERTTTARPVAKTKDTGKKRAAKKKDRY